MLIAVPLTLCDCNTLTLTFANLDDRNMAFPATNEHTNEYPGWNHLLFTKN